MALCGATAPLATTQGLSSPLSARASRRGICSHDLLLLAMGSWCCADFSLVMLLMGTLLPAKATRFASALRKTLAPAFLASGSTVFSNGNMASGSRLSAAAIRSVSPVLSSSAVNTAGAASSAVKTGLSCGALLTGAS